MSDNKKASTDAAVEVAAAEAKVNRLEQLLELLLAGQQEQQLEKQAKKQREQAIAAQREKTANKNLQNLFVFQSRCKHLKGGKHKLKADQKIDPNVSIHNFIDGKTVVKCHTCGAKWRPEDTVEFLIRDGKKVKNHTGSGWSDAAPGKMSALQMIQLTTNSISSSEIPNSQWNRRQDELAEQVILPENFEF
jgi:hypothetical protein